MVLGKTHPLDHRLIHQLLQIQMLIVHHEKDAELVRVFRIDHYQVQQFGGEVIVFH